MKFIVCAVRDSVAGEFLSPALEPSSVRAVRNFESSVIGATDGLLFTHPEHFDLYSLGYFDSETGLFTNEEHSLLRKADEVM